MRNRCLRKARIYGESISESNDDGNDFGDGQETRLLGILRRRIVVVVVGCNGADDKAERVQVSERNYDDGRLALLNSALLSPFSSFNYIIQC